MSEMKAEAAPQPVSGTPADATAVMPVAPRGRRPIGGFILLAVMAFGSGAYWWMTQPPQPEPVLPYGSIIVGAGACLAAVVAYIRR